MTHAMNRGVEDRRPVADETVKGFTVEPSQNGVCVLVDGRVAGAEIVSDPAAFERLWPRIIRSYALGLSSRPPDAEDESGSPLAQATEFIQQIREAEHTEHTAVSDGRDHRYVVPEMVGSVLAWEETIVHVSILQG